jgi:ribonuclease-3 family protein
VNEFSWISTDKARAANPDLLPPLVLAYVGDAVYELFVRTGLALRERGSVHKLHMAATEYARSASQADVLHHIHALLTEKEQDIVRRGRNARPGYVPKNADVVEYRYATGFEALVGYLYLRRDFERLFEILTCAVERVKSRKKDGDGQHGAAN